MAVETTTPPRARVLAWSRAPALVRDEPLLFALTLLAAAAFSAMAVLRYVHLEGTFDLAIFDQAVWHYSRFEAPETTLIYLETAGEPPPYILGDHFHVILVTLAPLYWLWDDARMLLVAQAALVAASAIPVFLFSRLHLSRLAAYLITLAYLAYWALHTGVTFSFHEVAFAPLLIALAVYFAAIQRWIPMFVSLGLLLLVKENFAVFVVFFGIYLLLLRQRREALVVAASGVAWYLLATKLFIPLFSEGRPFRHWSFTAFGDGFTDALATVLRDPTRPFIVAITPSVKVETMFFLVAPFLGLVLYSPLLVIALPLLAERMLSDRPNFWSQHLHYSLAIAPVIAMAAAQGLRNVLGFFRVRHLELAATALAAVMLLANVTLARRYPAVELFRASSYRVDDDARAAADVVSRVPRHDASVATQVKLASHLSQRSKIYLLRPETPVTDYIVYRVGGDDATSAPDIAREQEALRERRSRYRVLYARGPYRVLKLEGA